MEVLEAARSATEAKRLRRTGSSIDGKAPSRRSALPFRVKAAAASCRADLAAAKLYLPPSRPSPPS